MLDLIQELLVLPCLIIHVLKDIIEVRELQQKISMYYVMKVYIVQLHLLVQVEPKTVASQDIFDH